MTLDFRASQFRGAKFIASGSTGTGARILFYDIAADSTTTPNIGSINPAKFVTSSIGVDVFLYVSGTVTSGSSTDAISVFGGSLKVSGVLSVGSSSVRIDSNSILFSSASHATGSVIKVEDTAVGTGLSNRNNIAISAGRTFASGAGGNVYVTAGAAGWTGAPGAEITGGSIIFQTGQAAVVTGSAADFGAGGDTTISHGGGSATYTTKKAGSGGSFLVNGGTGGSGAPTITGQTGGGGVGGAITLTAGNGGIHEPANGVFSAINALPGDGGDISIYAGDGGIAIGSGSSALSGFGGSITLVAGDGSTNEGWGHGREGGDIVLSPGVGGDGYQTAVSPQQAKSGDIQINGSARYYPGDEGISGSNIEILNINRFFYNAQTDIDSITFPGRDIGFYVSGTRGLTADDIARKAVFGGDVYVSGALLVNGVAVSTGSSGAVTASVHVFTGSVYTVTNDDNNKIILCVSATVVRVTGSTLPGVSTEFIQSGSGQVTFGTAAQHFVINRPATFNSGTNQQWSNAVVTVATASVGSNYAIVRGDLELLVTSSLVTTYMPIGSYLSTTSTASNPQVAGQAVVSQSETGNYDIRLRGVLSTTNASFAATIKLWNVSAGAYVEIGGSGDEDLQTTSTTPTQVQSVNLLTATGFNTGSNIYEVQVYTATGSQQAIHGSSMFVIF